MDCSQPPSSLPVPSGRPVRLATGKRNAGCVVHCAVCEFVCSAPLAVDSTHTYRQQWGGKTVSSQLCVCRDISWQVLCLTLGVLVKHSAIMTDTHLCSCALSRCELT